MSRELKFGVCNHNKLYTSLCTARKGEHFNRRKRKLGGGATVNKKSMVFIVCQENIGVFFVLIELCCHCRA